MRKLKLRAKGFLPLLLALAVLFSSASPALGAETVSDAASTIQLMKTEGDVSVTNRSGRALSVRKDMRLYSGYHAKTEEESYAWVNLDSSKLIKLDEVSEAEVRKSGKKLEVLLDSGNLYFDISQPLDQTESLNVRTSTMIVGIRGTCGWVKMFDAWHAQVYLLEGRVECSVTDPATGESRTTVLQGGETAEFVVYPQGQTGERCEIIRESYSEEEIDGFVLVELVKDQPLCEKIYADSSLDVLGRYDQDSAQKRLEEDQAAMGEKLGQIEKDLSAQDNHVSQDPVWDGGSKDSGGSDSSGGGSDSSGGDSGSGGGSGGGDSGGSTTAPESSVVTLTMPVTDMALQQALNRPAVRQVAVAPGAAPSTLDIGISMAVDSGKTLTLNSGVPVRVQGSLTVNGTVDAGDDLTNDGTVTVNSANTLRVAGSLTNNNTMTVTATGRCVTEGAFTNSAGASLALTEGAQVLAGRFVLTAPVEGWSVSSTQTDGYYRLEADGEPEPIPTPEPEPEPEVTVGDFTVIGGTQDVDYSFTADESGLNTLTILTGKALTIKNTDPSTATTDHIVVSANVNANITLAGVNINAPDSNIYAFHVDYAETETGTGTGTVTVTLAGTNSLQRGLFRPGLNARGAARLTIGGTGTLTDDGPVADEPQPIIEANHLTMNGGTVDGEITASSFALNSGTVNGNVNVDNSLTMAAGAVNGDIFVSSFAMTGGKVNGWVSVTPIGDSDSFTISGGEIVSSKNHAVTAAGGVTLSLTGGTITCDASNYSALSLGNTTDFPAECKTVIRGKDFAMKSLPDGYENSLHDDGYYYLVPWGKTTLSSDGLTAAAIQNELDKANVDEVCISGASSVTLDGELAIPAGKVLSLSDTVDLTVSDSASLENNGTIDLNSRSLTVNGTLTNSGVIRNCGNLALTAPGSKLEMLDGEISGMGTTTWMITVPSADSLDLRGGTITCEDSLCAVMGPFGSGTLQNVGTVIRGKFEALLKNDTESVNDTMGYQAELREDGYYYLVKKKEENP